MRKSLRKTITLLVMSVILLSSCDAVNNTSSLSSESQTSATSESSAVRSDISYDDMIKVLYNSMADELFYEDYIENQEENLRQQQAEADNEINHSRGIIRFQEIGQDLGDERYCSFALIEYDTSSEAYQNLYVGDDIKVHINSDAYSAKTDTDSDPSENEYKVTAVYGQYVLCLNDMKGFSSTYTPPYFNESANNIYNAFLYLSNGGSIYDPIPVIDEFTEDYDYKDHIVYGDVPEIAFGGEDAYIASSEPY